MSGVTTMDASRRSEAAGPSNTAPAAADDDEDDDDIEVLKEQSLDEVLEVRSNLTAYVEHLRICDIVQ